MLFQRIHFLSTRVTVLFSSVSASRIDHILLRRSPRLLGSANTSRGKHKWLGQLNGQQRTVLATSNRLLVAVSRFSSRAAIVSPVPSRTSHVKKEDTSSTTNLCGY